MQTKYLMLVENIEEKCPSRTKMISQQNESVIKSAGYPNIYHKNGYLEA
jgi:hypothetical protein